MIVRKVLMVLAFQLPRVFDLGALDSVLVEEDEWKECPVRLGLRAVECSFAVVDGPTS